MYCQRKITHILLIFLLCITALPVHSELNSFIANYKIYSLSITQASVSNKLIINNKNYHYESNIQPVGWIAFLNNAYRFEYSEGMIKNNQIIPHKYGYYHSERLKNNREIEVTFDHQQNKIINYHKHIENKWKMASVSQVQDRLSSQLSLMLALQQSNIPENKAHFNFPIADGGRLKEYYFTILAEEKIQTPLGLLNTIKLEHRRSNQDEIMIIWCAEELAYLPVKILQKQKGLPDYISIISSYTKN